MSDPQLAVIVITPDNYQTVSVTLRHLRAQTAREQLEMVIVCPAPARLAADDELLRQFHSVRVVPHGAMTSTAAARAAGVRAATAPVVAFAEEHSFPQPGWAAALIAAHRQPCAGVGPAIGLVLPLMVAGLAIDGFGELVGYLGGAGDAMRTLTDMEFHRPRFLTEADRRLFGE